MTTKTQAQNVMARRDLLINVEVCKNQNYSGEKQDEVQAHENSEPISPIPSSPSSPPEVRPKKKDKRHRIDAAKLKEAWPTCDRSYEKDSDDYCSEQTCFPPRSARSGGYGRRQRRVRFADPPSKRASSHALSESVANEASQRESTDSVTESSFIAPTTYHDGLLRRRSVDFTRPNSGHTASVRSRARSLSERTSLKKVEEAGRAQIQPLRQRLQRFENRLKSESNVAKLLSQMSSVNDPDSLLL